MKTLLSRKRSLSGEYEGSDTSLDIPGKRRRSRSLSSGDEVTQLDHDLFKRMRALPTAYELDRISHHISLQEFGSELGKAANAIFPNKQTSRYRRVDVILLSWEAEDPKLPVSMEINELADVFMNIYGFNVEQWLIPSDDCHNQLQKRVLDFLGANDPTVLKIVYYAGHGKLTNHGQLAWTSILDSKKDRCPTAKWSGIQNTLEESRSDVLIMLDCCASGICTTDEGNGVTELIAACPHNAKANGVGRFSFTHALILKLRALAPLPHFTVGYLYNTIFTEIQGWRNEDSRHKMVPIHLVLSQNNDRPRSIQLSKVAYSSIHKETPSPTFSTEEVLSDPSISQDIGQTCLLSGSKTTQATSSDPSQVENDTSTSSGHSTSQPSSMTSMSPTPEYPRLLFSIRVNENVKPSDLSTELFSEWLRDIPTSVTMVRVEAGFACNSTLLLVSIPASMLGYLPTNPAVLLLGTIRSRNIMLQPAMNDISAEQRASLKQGDTQSQQGSDSSSLDIYEDRRRNTESPSLGGNKDFEANSNTVPIDIDEEGDYNNIPRPRQEISDPPYRDQAQASPPTLLLQDAHSTAEYDKQINSQSAASRDYLQGRWNRPHESPVSNTTLPAVTSKILPPTQALQSPRTSTANTQQTSMPHQDQNDNRIVPNARSEGASISDASSAQGRFDTYYNIWQKGRLMEQLPPPRLLKRDFNISDHNHETYGLTRQDEMSMYDADRKSQGFGGLGPSLKVLPEYIARKVQAKTKGYIASACVPCKRAHFRCDAQRPCSRCLSNGKEDACVDVQHKKRGRPRLREEREPIFQPRPGPPANAATNLAPETRPRDLGRSRSLDHGDLPLFDDLRADSMLLNYDAAPQEASIRRPISSYTPEIMVETRTAIADALQPTLQPLPSQKLSIAYLTMDMKIVKATREFKDAVGMVVPGKLDGIVSPSDRDIVFRLQRAFEDERREREPNYLLPIHLKYDEERVIRSIGFSVEEISSFRTGHYETITFWDPDNEQHRTFLVQFGLAKKESTFFIILMINSLQKAQTYYQPSSLPPIRSSLFQEINAPTRTPITSHPSIFLAGSIADNYHSRITTTLHHLPITILNPLRPDWSSLLPENINNAPFQEQVTWELNMQEVADLVIVYFAKGTEAPISLLELGMAVRRGGDRILVGVAEGYKKEGNVRVVCQRFGVRCFSGLEELKGGVLEVVKGLVDSKGS